MVLDFDFIKSVIPTAVCRGKPLESISAWTVDSRKVQKGAIFIALRGSKTDGHDFLSEAYERGAVGFVLATSKRAALEQFITHHAATTSFIIVDDPAQAVCALAAAWRKQFLYPVIGITGSAGKTTTKEILGNIVRCNGMRFVLSEGTQNTLIGISMNILRMRQEHAIAIFEMGISKRGEMAALARLVQPTVAVITSIGHCHMEGLGSLADIAAEKRDIFHCLQASGIGIIDGDQPLLTAVSYQHPVIKFGKKMVNQVQARKIEQHDQRINFQLKLYDQRFSITLATENSVRVYNALAAAATAYAVGIAPAVICAGLQEPVMVAGRFRKCPAKGSNCVIIDDSYNANPESMKAALEAFEQMQSPGKKVAVLGDMLELGLTSPFWHRQLGRLLRKVPSLQQVIFVGEQVQWARNMVPFGLGVRHVKTWEEALRMVQEELADISLLLVKGSLGIKLGKLVDALETGKHVS